MINLFIQCVNAELMYVFQGVQREWERVAVVSGVGISGLSCCFALGC